MKSTCFSFKIVASRKRTETVKKHDLHKMYFLLIGGFPKIVVPHIIHFSRVFLFFHHPFWGKHPYFWKHPYRLQLSFVFFPFWWKGNYSSLPQQLPQCFRNHSASFRDTLFTYNPSASFRDLVFLVFASATTAPLCFPRFLVVVWFHFLLFWPLGPSFAFIFTFWAFISFHFLLLLSFVLGLDAF